VIALKETPKLQNAATIAHTAKTVARILRRRIERKIEGVLGEDQFGFRRGKGTRDAIETLRIISERTLETDGEL
jgi:phosphotransacetylase